MNSTKQSIVQLGEELIRNKGFNAFSYYDISKPLGIKHAAIHYHFPKKSDLGIAVLKYYGDAFGELIDELRGKHSGVKLKAFLNIFSRPFKERTTCIIGSLTPDMHTFNEEMQSELKTQVERILLWLTWTLKEGLESKQMTFPEDPRTKALLIITNMLAALSIARITGDRDFEAIKKSITESTITK